MIQQNLQHVVLISSDDDDDNMVRTPIRKELIGKSRKQYSISEQTTTAKMSMKTKKITMTVMNNEF